MNAIRKIVSGDKKRYVENKYDLDLSYITPRIIAMAFPASGIETIYRNSINDVADFLKEKHQSHYLIINLSGRKYDYKKFENKVEEFEWLDHHAPPLMSLFKICNRMYQYLQEDINNVVVVNCQAGKGRTGTIICCFLLFSGLFTSPEECFLYYSKKRFQKGEGVTQPSQRRYVEYFYQMINETYCFPYIINIFGIYLNKLPIKLDTKFKPFVQFFSKNSEEINYSNQKSYFEQKKIFANDEDIILITDESFSRQVFGDVTIKLFNNEMMKVKEIGRISFNTAFLNPNETMLIFKLKEIDPDNLVKNKDIPKDFQIILKYKIVCKCQQSNSSIDNICNNCRPLLENEIKEWKLIRDIIGDLKISGCDGKKLIFGNSDDDLKNNIYHSIDSFCRDTDQEINNADDNDKLNTSGGCVIF